MLKELDKKSGSHSMISCTQLLENINNLCKSKSVVPCGQEEGEEEAFIKAHETIFRVIDILC
jgi:hypothetical protein